MTERATSKLEILYERTYGPRRNPVLKEFMNRDEIIALSPLGSTQPTDISKRLASLRKSLSPVMKKALNYLYPARNSGEKPPKTKYDLMVRKMSNFSLLENYENTSKRIILSPLREIEKKTKNKRRNAPSMMKKMVGIFNFPKREGEKSLALLKKRSKSTLKLPRIAEHQRFSSVDYINCINYTGEAESEYLKSKEGQKEYKKLYELLLIDSGLYQEMRIRNQTKKKIHYKRMPV